LWSIRSQGSQSLRACFVRLHGGVWGQNVSTYFMGGGCGGASRLHKIDRGEGYGDRMSPSTMFSPQTAKHSSPYGLRNTRTEERVSPTSQARSYIAYHYRDTQLRRRVHEFRILWDPVTDCAVYAEQNHAYPLQLPSTATLREIITRLQLQEAIVEVRWVDTRTPFDASIFDVPIVGIPVSELMLYEPGYHEEHWMEA